MREFPARLRDGGDLGRAVRQHLRGRHIVIAVLPHAPASRRQDGGDERNRLRRFHAVVHGLEDGDDDRVGGKLHAGRRRRRFGDGAAPGDKFVSRFGTGLDRIGAGLVEPHAGRRHRAAAFPVRGNVERVHCRAAAGSRRQFPIDARRPVFRILLGANQVQIAIEHDQFAPVCGRGGEVRRLRPRRMHLDPAHAAIGGDKVVVLHAGHMDGAVKPDSGNVGSAQLPRRSRATLRPVDAVGRAPDFAGTASIGRSGDNGQQGVAGNHQPCVGTGRPRGGGFLCPGDAVGRTPHRAAAAGIHGPQLAVEGGQLHVDRPPGSGSGLRAPGQRAAGALHGRIDRRLGHQPDFAVPGDGIGVRKREP